MMATKKGNNLGKVIKPIISCWNHFSLPFLKSLQNRSRIPSPTRDCFIESGHLESHSLPRYMPREIHPQAKPLLYVLAGDSNPARQQNWNVLPIPKHNRKQKVAVAFADTRSLANRSGRMELATMAAECSFWLEFLLIDVFFSLVKKHLRVLLRHFHSCLLY